VGLKDQDGLIQYALYNEKDNTYTLYNQIKLSNFIFAPIETDKIIKNYLETTITINGVKLSGFKLNKTSKFVILYGKNIETNEEGWYSYEEEENTLQKYNSELTTYFSKEIDKNKQMIEILIGILSVTCLLLLMISFKKPKKKKINEIIKKVKPTNDKKKKLEEIIKNEKELEEKPDLEKTKKLKNTKEFTSIKEPEKSKTQNKEKEKTVNKGETQEIKKPKKIKKEKKTKQKKIKKTKPEKMLDNW
jgi:hypothetical protein